MAHRRRWSSLFGMAAVLSIGTGTTTPEAPTTPVALRIGWYARIVTSEGTIVAKLLPEQAPQSVAHFAGLASGTLAWTDVVTGESKKGHYYDGIQVHRAEAGQRFEAGDRTGTGRGAPAMYVPTEGLRPVDFGRPGRLGMTRGSRGRLSAVQFFVTASAMPWLNRSHPCFGEVVEGLEVAFNISQVKTYPNGRPIEPVLLESIRIFSVGDPAPLPEPQPYTPALMAPYKRMAPK